MINGLEETAAVAIPAKITKAWVASLTVPQFATVLTKARDAYYNSAKPVFTDKVFDAMEDEFRKRAPNHKYWDKVGAPIKSGTGRPAKVRLAMHMGSLSKAKTPEELQAFIGDADTVLLEDKLDGLSMQVASVNGGDKAFTRGNGTVGQDITHLLPHIKGHGKLPRGWIIRGELGVSRSDFSGKLAKEFANPRNLASGIANTKGVSPNAGKLTLVIHTIQKPVMSIDAAAAKLKAAGWLVVFHKRVAARKLHTVMPAFLAARKAQSKFDIDGIVMDIDGRQIAFKGEDDKALATVGSIEWTPSRFGMLNPVVILSRPVMLAGVSVKRASVYNAKFVVDNGLGPGAMITMIRSGEVIPKVLSVSKKVDPSLPPKGTWDWNKTKVDIYLKTAAKGEEHGTITAKRLTHWLTTLGVEGAKYGLVSRLVDNGVATIVKLRKASVVQLQAAGLGPVQAASLKRQIDAQVAAAPLPSMMDGSGIFGRGWGTDRFTKLLSVHSYDDLLLAAGRKIGSTTGGGIEAMISAVPGLGATMADGFGPALLKFNVFCTKIGYAPAFKKAKAVKGRLTGQIFAFSGFRSPEMEAKITALGGSVKGLSKATTTLIVADKSGTSTKIVAAKKNKTAIIDVKEAQKLLKG